MATLTLDKLAGKRIVAARPLNDAELRLEGNGAYAGVLLDLGRSGCIVIVQKTMDDDEFPSDDCWTEARWMTDGGESVSLDDSGT